MKRNHKKESKGLKFIAMFFLLAIVLILAGAGVKFLFKKFLVTNIQVVEVRPDPKLIHQRDIDFLKRENIFSVDLDKASIYLSQKYPQFSLIKLHKQFPDKVIIELSSRERFAQIKAGSLFYVVDRNFVVISKEKSRVDGLIELKGVSLLKSNKEKIARTLVEFFTKNTQYPKVTLIDVSILPDIKLTLYSGIIVIIGAQEFNEKIKILLYLLPKVKPDIEKIKYIDLRFKEPVINYK